MTKPFSGTLSSYAREIAITVIVAVCLLGFLRIACRTAIVCWWPFN
ncbi:MAG: hypothetical protein QGH82_05955 [Candidatus Woesearchaeota archaeon]|nr:hypothetical protein [Candidatus Woesearchaeota archaeon]